MARDPQRYVGSRLILFDLRGHRAAPGRLLLHHLCHGCNSDDQSPAFVPPADFSKVCGFLTGSGLYVHYFDIHVHCVRPPGPALASQILHPRRRLRRASQER